MKTTSLLAAAAVIAGCAHAVTVTGTPVYDGVASAYAAPGNGVRSDAPEPTLVVEGTDGGPVDRVTAVAVEDVLDFWDQTALPGGAGKMTPPQTYVSYDSRSRGDAKMVCGNFTYKMVNAAYCPSQNLVMWDRGLLIPGLQRVAGDLAVSFVMSHEMGHHVQREVNTVSRIPVIVGEAQADCYAGSYLRWVADGSSQRFTINSDGAGEVLRAISLAGDAPHVIGEEAPNHGTASERVWYTQQGFLKGVDYCAKISARTIGENRAGMPVALSQDEAVSGGNVEFTEDFVEMLANEANAALNMPDDVTLTSSDCSQYDRPVAWCADSGKVYAPSRNLNRHIEEMNSGDVVGRIGDGTAIGGLVNAVAQRWIEKQGVSTTGRQAGYRAACVVGSVIRVMADPGIPHRIQFSAGDADEVMTDLLYDGYTAMDATGAVASGIFERTLAYLTGMYRTTTPSDCLVTYP